MSTVSYPMLARASRGNVSWTLVESPDGRSAKPFAWGTGPFRYEIGMSLEGRLRAILTIDTKTDAWTAFATLSDINHGWFPSDGDVYLRLRAHAATLGGSLEDQ